MMEIKEVAKGSGDNYIIFSTDHMTIEDYRVDEIKQESKQVSNDIIINVYRGYKNGKIFFEMGASIDVTIWFKHD